MAVVSFNANESSKLSLILEFCSSIGNLPRAASNRQLKAKQDSGELAPTRAAHNRWENIDEVKYVWEATKHLLRR